MADPYIKFEVSSISGCADISQGVKFEKCVDDLLWRTQSGIRNTFVNEITLTSPAIDNPATFEN